MTTKRTAIRRWLSVGGSPHRPPWRARKARHRSIVAPLAATLAATAAVGLGMALAKGGAAAASRASARAGSWGWRRPRACSEGLRRMALEQTDLALEQLAGAEGGEAAQGRARDAQGDQAPARDRAPAAQRAGRGHAARASRRPCATRRGQPRRRARRRGDAEHARRPGREPPGKLASRAGVARLRRHLDIEREQRRSGAMLEPGNRIDGRRRAAAVPRPRARLGSSATAPGIEPIEEGLGRDLPAGPPPPAPRGRQARRADAHDAPVAQAGQGPALRRRSPAASRPRRRRAELHGKRRKRADAEARWIVRVASRADELGEAARRGARPGGAAARGCPSRAARAGVGPRHAAPAAQADRAAAAQAPPPRAARRDGACTGASRGGSCAASRAPTSAARASADAEDGQAARAARQRDRRLLAGGAPEQRGRHRRFDRQTALPRRRVVGADDPPGLLDALWSRTTDRRAEADDAAGPRRPPRRRPRRRSARAAARSSSRGAPARSWRRGTRCSPSDRPTRARS